MRRIPIRHLRSVGLEAVDSEGRVLLETPEHEVVDFDGCSADEIDAKLRDYQSWAS